jgi:hypothetical protein
LNVEIWSLIILPTMLQKLRNLDDIKKRKVVIVSSVLLSAIVFVFWFFHFFGVFGAVLRDTKDRGYAAIDTIKRNIGAMNFEYLNTNNPASTTLDVVDNTTKTEEEVSTTTEDVLYNSEQEINNLVIN